MEYVFMLEKIKYERETETICITTVKEDLIKLCESINGDYNVTVWKNGVFMDVYLDIEEQEIIDLFQ